MTYEWNPSPACCKVHQEIKWTNKTLCLVDWLKHEQKKVTKTEHTSPKKTLTPLKRLWNGEPQCCVLWTGTIWLFSYNLGKFVLSSRNSHSGVQHNKNVFSTKIKKGFLCIRNLWNVRWQQISLYVQVKNICIRVENVLFGTLMLHFLCSTFSRSSFVAMVFD